MKKKTKYPQKMKKKTIDLQYAKKESPFFEKVKGMRDKVSNYKLNKKVAEFTQADEDEIGEGFKSRIVNGVRMPGTIIDFRKSLAEDRGIYDSAFQNKIWSVILKGRMGLDFGISDIIEELSLGHPIRLGVRKDSSPYYVYRMKKDNSVDILFTEYWYNDEDDSDKPLIEVNCTINISPDMVAITEFRLELPFGRLLTKTEKQFFNALEANQQNILEKFISWIKRVLGFNSELRLEETKDNDPSWETPTP